MRHGSHPHIPRGGIQPGGEEHLRQPSPIAVPNIEQEPLKYVALALTHLRREIAKIPVMLADQSKPFDEYNVQTLAVESNPLITLQPQWEFPEIIESIIITGPAAATATLKLGDRVWNLVMPATQILPLVGPLGICLSRSDDRILQPTIATGEWSLELMGHADTRGIW